MKREYVVLRQATEYTTVIPVICYSLTNCPHDRWFLVNEPFDAVFIQYMTVNMTDDIKIMLTLKNIDFYVVDSNTIDDEVISVFDKAQASEC